jgi:hypothetical protein
MHVASADTLTRLLRYLGAMDEQIAKHGQDRHCSGQGSSRLLPNRRTLLRIDYAFAIGVDFGPGKDLVLLNDYAPSTSHFRAFRSYLHRQTHLCTHEAKRTGGRAQKE